jgi:hypothetical protein
MRTGLRLLAAAVALTVAATLPGGAQPGGKKEPPKVEVRVVKYDALADFVSRQLGKVVVIDFWHTG